MLQRFDRVHTVMLYASALFGMFALAWAGAASAIGIGVAFPVLLLSLVWRSDSEFSQRVLTGVALLFVAFSVVRGVQGASVLELCTDAMLVLLAVRVATWRKPKHSEQVVLLATAHLIAASAFTASIGFALFFIVFAFTLPLAMSLAHLRNFAPSLAPEQSRSLDRMLSGRFMGMMISLGLPALVISAVLFVLFPRVGQNFVPFGRESSRPSTGFSDHVSLGGVGTISQDPSVVLRVFGADKDELLRMRGTTFDVYDGGNWSRALNGSSPINADGVGRYSIPHQPRRGDLRRLRVQLEPLAENVLFLTPDSIVVEITPESALVGDGSQARRMPRPLQLSEGPELRHHDLADGRIDYSLFELSGAPGVPARLTDAARAQYLIVPISVASLREPASALAAATDSLTARRIERHLQRPPFLYSLDQPEVRDGEDPIVAFYNTHRRGHCEYFASTMALMLRTQGIPSRTVAGYAGGVPNRFGGFRYFRQQDAHLWVEAYIDGAWHTFDPTPSGGLPSNAPAPGAQRLRELFDAMRAAWTKRVVGFELGDQLGALSAMRDWWRDDAPAKKSEEGATEGAIRWPLWPIVPLLLILCVAAWWVWRRRRRRLEYAVANLIRLMCARFDLSFPEGRPLGIWLRALPKQHDMQEPIEALDAYIAFRFGAKSSDDEVRALIERAVLALKRNE